MRNILIVEAGTRYKVKVKIGPRAWKSETNKYQWYYVELLIDGQHVRRRFLQKPDNQSAVSHVFDMDTSNRPFEFNLRHEFDENRGYDNIKDDDKVGMIQINFGRAMGLSNFERDQNCSKET
eukprot:UN17210